LWLGRAQGSRPVVRSTETGQKRLSRPAFDSKHHCIHEHIMVAGTVMQQMASARRPLRGSGDRCIHPLAQWARGPTSPGTLDYIEEKAGRALHGQRFPPAPLSSVVCSSQRVQLALRKTDRRATHQRDSIRTASGSRSIIGRHTTAATLVRTCIICLVLLCDASRMRLMPLRRWLCLLPTTVQQSG
jgi:hypothetical protein